MLAALAFLTVGGILVYSAFETPPDPREVVSRFFGGKAKAEPTTVGVNPRATRR